MGILNQFERRLEGVIEGIFSKAFRTGLQPVELARRVLKEMEANKTVGVREIWVPNRYAFTLGEADRQRFEGTERALKRELEQVVVEGARERGWGLVGPPEVTFETDLELGHGEFACVPSLVEGPPTGDGSTPDGRPDSQGAPSRRRPRAATDGLPKPEDARAWELVLLEAGRPSKTFPVTGSRLSIGRLADSDVSLTDPGVSRRHAEVREQDGRWIVADLGSTNGTQVNGSTIGTWVLEDGDRITVGTTVLEFRRR